MGSISFDPQDDPGELISALRAEGYAVEVYPEASIGCGSAEPTIQIMAEPFDAGVEALVDVYGGWIDGDPRLPAAEEPGSAEESD